MRWFVALLVFFSAQFDISATAQLGTLPYSGAIANTGSFTLALGGGGYETNIDIACDQGISSCNNSGTVTMVERNDTYGAHWFNPNATPCGNTPLAGCWQQIVTSNSMPGSAIGADGGVGSYEIVVAPSNTQHFYLYYNSVVYTTTNRGTNWTACAGWSAVAADPAGANRGMGNFMAVDPADETRLLVGTPNSGVFYSTDGCATFTHISAIANSSTGNNALVAFDFNSISGGSTPRACATSYGTGIYCTTTGLAGTWALINSTGMPTTFWRMTFDRSGNLFVVDNTGGGGGKLNSYISSTWAQVSSGVVGSDAQSVTIDSNNASHLYAISRNNPGVLYGSTAGPAGTWFKTTGTPTLAATDVPWLAFTNEAGFMTPGGLEFDPSGSNRVFFTEGIGVWKSNPPTSAAALTWTSQTAGIETLDINQVMSPSGGKPIIGAQDRPEFYVSNPASYPSSHGLANPTANSIIDGFSVEWTTATPGTVIGMGIKPFTSPVNESGISTNGGQTFSAFGGAPSVLSLSNMGGCLAATDATHFIWVLANQVGPYVSSNGGSSWAAATGLPSAEGWPNGAFTSIMCAADRVTASTFYLYNYNSNGSNADAVYVSSNGGSTWTQQCVHCAGSGNSFSTNGSGVNGFNQMVLQASPVEAGVLLFTPGHTCCISHPTVQPFWLSTNSGVTWTAVANMQDVWAAGFGAAMNGSTHATIYAWGWLSGVRGLWRSTDNGSTWTQLDNGYPLGIFAPVFSIVGDTSIPGKVYECFAKGGCVYGQFN